MDPGSLTLRRFFDLGSRGVKLVMELEGKGGAPQKEQPPASPNHF